jgi:restriction endonuclease S subunit
MKSLEEIHKACHKIFREGFFEVPEDTSNDDVTWFGASKACKIYDKLTDGDDTKQDSIGENFNQLIQRIDNNWFEKYSPILNSISEIIMLNKLPTNWDLKKVDDVANIYLGLTYTPTYTESGVPFLSVKDLNDTYLDFEKSKFISYEEYKNATENAKPKKGDIIFGRVGTLGNPLIIETDIEFCIFVSLGFFRIKDNSCVPNFLASWMKSPLFHKQVDNIVAGGAQKNLNTGWLKNFVIPIPPLPEQKAIAQVLSTADAAIHTTEKLIAQKELRKKWVMQQLLTGKKRLKGFDGEWKEMHLGDLGVSFNGLTGKTKENFGSGFPFITYMNVFSNSLRLKKL